MAIPTTTVDLPDGRQLVVREPSVENDLDALLAFFNSLSPKIVNVLRFKVTDREVCQARLAQLDGKNHWRVVGELDGEIVGDATMDREPYGWTRHVAQVRAVIKPEHRNLRIEPILFAQLVNEGSKHGIERLVTELFATQRDLIESLRHEGFEYEFKRKAYARDQRGKLHDVVVMSNDLGRVWRQLAEQLHEMDIGTARRFHY
ncbi:MAG: hypothetical protein JW797_08205 [Bradymonadales bacterium]|nr:hypothetical protein [Bradymonadales bacterium]